MVDRTEGLERTGIGLGRQGKKGEEELLRIEETKKERNGIAAGRTQRECGKITTISPVKKGRGHIEFT